MGGGAAATYQGPWAFPVEKGCWATDGQGHTLGSMTIKGPVEVVQGPHHVCPALKGAMSSHWCRGHPRPAALGSCQLAWKLALQPFWAMLAPACSPPLLPGRVASKSQGGAVGPSALSTSRGTKPPPTTPWPMVWDWLVHDPGILPPAFQEPRPGPATPTVLGAQTDTQPPPLHTPNDPFELVLGFVDGQGTPEMPSQLPCLQEPRGSGLAPLPTRRRDARVQPSTPIYML